MKFYEIYLVGQMLSDLGH